MVSGFALGTVLAGTSLLSALAALLVAHIVLAARQRPGDVIPFHVDDTETVFIFDGENLVDASGPARALLGAIGGEGSEWQRLSAWLARRIPSFHDHIARLGEEGCMDLSATGTPPLHLSAEWRAGLARLVLRDPEAEGQLVAIDRLSHLATQAELAQLRQTLEHAPAPVWRESGDGTVIWANPAYLALASARDAAAGVLTWPLPRVFDTVPRGLSGDAADTGTAPGGTLFSARLEVNTQPGPRWFDCRICPAGGGDVLGFALPADDARKAEKSLGDFIRTLTRTFANLPIGLAIFDRQRRLQVFNPALTDLTTLGPEFLSGQPSLDSFFDALRSRQMIPEPRDYRSWRQALTAVERAAAAGHFEETWSLASGQTYRVTGRPHPDGAVAFLIEDISAEISLTRRFRSQIETGQAVLDSLPEAIAVFSSTGALVMSNQAYDALWPDDSATRLHRMGVAEVIESWRARAHPGPHWAQLRTLIGAGGPRRDWQGDIQLRDGRHMLCQLTPLAGGATLVGFSAHTRTAPHAAKGTAAATRAATAQTAAKTPATPKPRQRKARA
ncbi:PAS-domain containing protein [Alkalilacustris brevis]|uniref:PAS-domain containing protein n=1 Tax=Alkalilacustris brevis TaxID=2026338 RepID=UPI000E0DD493|nr:PAS-domain containing protein [Alkalilacustris brevis]